MYYILKIIEQIIKNIHFLCAVLAVAAAIRYMGIVRQARMIQQGSEIDIFPETEDHDVINLKIDTDSL